MTDSQIGDENSRRDDSRREFIRGSSLLLAGALPTAGVSLGAKSDRISKPFPESEIRFGLVGCGYRGMAIASQLLSVNNSLQPARLPALADAFPDRLQQALRTLRGRHGDRVTIDCAGRCVGLQAYRALLATDVHAVVLATPPVFRPTQFAAAVAAGKHVHVELPIAVDVPGVARFQMSAALAHSQGCVVRVGWPHRDNEQLRLTVERLQAGEIGAIQSIQAWQPIRPKNLSTSPKSQSKFNTQLRNWTHFPWASGGPLVEQRVQILDIVNWLLQGHPLAARTTAMLPRPGDNESSLRTASSPVEFMYPGEVELVCQSTTPEQSQSKAAIWVQAAAGRCELIAGEIFDAQGKLIWRASDELGRDPRRLGASVTDFVGADVAGDSLNQGLTAVDSTLTAILGRMAAARTEPVSWEECVQSQEIFDCINLSHDDLGVDRTATIERYLTGSSMGST